MPDLVIQRPMPRYSDKQAQDAVGAMLVDTATIDLTYDDTTPALTVAVKDGSVTYAKLQPVSATDRLLGRSAAGAGPVQELVCTPAGRALLDDADAAAQRTTLGLGTLATQNANAVAITGGTAQLGDLTAQRLGVNANISADAIGTLRTGASVVSGGGLQVAGQSVLTGAVGIQATPLTSPTTAALTYAFNGGTWGIIGHANAPGNQSQVVFQNASAVTVGSINTTDAATSYNTSSDVRLKHNIQPLTDSLDLIRRLNPISHRWNADDSYAENFLAHELQRVLPYAVTGEPDAVSATGEILPQQVDLSKCVPRLVGAIKELLAQVEALTARVTTLEEALGV